MSYSNYDFLLLLPLLVALFYAAKSEIGQLGLLLVVSAIFLAWTTIWNLLPAVVVILAVYSFLRIDERRHLPTLALAALIVFLVAQLAYFRYRAFLSDIIGVEIPAPALISWLVPLGISFYTFEAISAAVDLHRRRQPVKLLTWSLFIMFLPHLIAGPIVRYRQLVPQFAGRKALRFRNLGIGLHFFTVGFCKKVAADPLGQATGEMAVERLACCGSTATTGCGLNGPRSRSTYADAHGRARSGEMPFGLWRSRAWRQADGSCRVVAPERTCTVFSLKLACSPRMRTDG
jgi:D-alanyl-lipoteichoic acid acyltransferase DltB (MBOAT superfamily)